MMQPAAHKFSSECNEAGSFAADDREASIIETILAGEKFRVVCDRPVAAAFWKKLARESWEADLVRFVQAEVDGDTFFVDIGAWMGPVSLLASRRARQVIAIEPDPVALNDLSRNVALNNANVAIVSAALDVEKGSLTLGAAQGLGASETSALTGDGERIEARAISFGDLSALLPDNVKIVAKMDVEGHEYRLAAPLAEFVARNRARLHLSLHPAILWRAEKARGASRFAARLAAWRATRNLLAALAGQGAIHFSADGAPLSGARLFAYLFLRRRPKNFSAIFSPRA